jgi:hypothetical protein
MLLIRGVADTQMGLITSAQLRELGVHSGTTSRRDAGGMWTRVLPGVHLVGGGHPSRLQREAAALLYAGPTGLITGLTAARHYGVRAVRLQELADDSPERPEPIHVLVSHERRRVSTGYVRIERTRRYPDEAQVRQGLALAPIARAVGDAARRLRRAGDVRALVTEVVQRNLVDVGALQEELDRGQMRGSALLRDAMSLVSEGVWSAPEADLAELFRAANVGSVIYNAALVDGRGRFVSICDAWMDDVGLAIEVDSIEHHTTPTGFARTLERNRRYALLGVTVLPILPSDLGTRPARVLADVSRARAAAAARPRPDVHVSTDPRYSSGREGWRWGA